MVPTKERNTPSAFLRYKTHGILFDCGEATQRQLKIAGIKLTKVTKILITHWHGDHMLGLPGLIQSLGAAEYTGTLDIYGPKGTKKYMKNMFESFSDKNRIKTRIIECASGVVYKDNNFSIESLPLEHTAPCVGFSFIENDKRRINVEAVKKLGIPEGPLLGKLADGKSITFKGKKITPENTTRIVKGKKIAYVTDTLLCDNCFKLAEDSDLLICESPFTSKLKDKAEKYKHITAAEAGMIASRSSVKKLILTHFSARYKETHDLKEDAKDYFDNVFCAYDFMKVQI